MRDRQRWPTFLVLAAGMALRVALAVVTPPERSYDDHFEPVRVILKEGRIPTAADCWECYQPPLYYLVSAGLCAVTQPLAAALTGSSESWEHVGRRTLQFTSVFAGGATLWVCWLILRRFQPRESHAALALALPAFLPAHLHMSAMATNDALTYLLAALAIYAALRAHDAGWPTRGCVTTGLLAGLTTFSKGYGWATVLAIALATWRFTRQPEDHREPRLPHEIARSLRLILIAALPLGIWPVAVNLWTYGKLHIDNFTMWPETPMRYQPPGSVTGTSFLSFRFADLLRHPWLHVAHVDSFWTQFYARLWFDYEGFNTTLAPYPPWQRLWERSATTYPEWNRQRWEILLGYGPNEVPPHFRRIAVISYVAGLPLSLCVLGGLLVALRKASGTFPIALLTIHFTFAAAVPLIHTLRLPHFAAMKTAFALSGLATAAVLIHLVPDRVGPRTLRVVVLGTSWLATAAIAAADVAFVLFQARQTWP